MKQYKLIKYYPNCSVKVGTLVVKNGDFYQSHFATRNVQHFHESLDTVEKYPEFWEEVKEKTFEILSFICLKKDIGAPFQEIRTLGVNTACSAEQYLNIGSSVKNGDWAIHSVKRLSDGEIFAIGDKVKLNGKYAKDWILDSIDSKGVFRVIKNPCGYDINNFIKIKQKLFTTLDGVDLFVGDIFYYIGDAFNVCETKCLFKGDGNFTKAKTFSTEISAKNYKKQNEKIYSLNDIKETVKKLDCFGSTLIEYLEKSVS